MRPPHRTTDSAGSGSTSPAAIDADTSPRTATTPGAIAGAWTVDTSIGEFSYEDSTGTFVGFRVAEELSGVGSTTAVGRTPTVTGRLEVEGTTVIAVAIEAELAAITTNDSRRDDRVQDALETGEFPTARFQLTEPIDLGDDAAAGGAVSVEATGTLTIHGITKTVTMPLDAQLTGDTISSNCSCSSVGDDEAPRVGVAPESTSREINMEHAREFYIGGKWVPPHGDETLAVINPATEQEIDSIAMGGSVDVDAAVAAARSAFEDYSSATRDERLALLDRVIEVYGSRMGDIGEVISQEMGAPLKFAVNAQSAAGIGHLMTVRQVLADFEFEHEVGTSLVVREPVGVCALITPWNWPLNQITCKVGPALAAGCTMVLKPSEVAPLSAILFAEVLDEAGVPPGVFNLVQGDGATVGAALSAHPDVDMVSFTGSTRAGIEVARAAAPTVKRVAQELGGKSANIILDDADLATTVARDVAIMCSNSGQSCNAPSRMLVPAARMDEAASAAAAAAADITVGDPNDDSSRIGPVVSQVQYDRIQGLIEKGVAEGARVEAGGPGKPDGLDTGYYVKPTVFSHVTNDMTIAREEIFGPVLVMIGYEDDDDAVRIANDTAYGLSGYISGDAERARAMARRIRTGNVHLNGAQPDFNAPFGGYKQSGNGREWGALGMEEYLETKAIVGYTA